MVKVRKHTQRPSRRQTKKPDTSTWLDRNQASDLLGVSPNTIMNYERRGLLHPERVVRRDSGGAERLHVVYEPAELTKLPRRERMSSPRDPGEVAARCYELIDAGKSDREIVIELRITRASVRELREDWDGGGGYKCMIVDAAWQALEDLVGRFTSVADLVERIAALKKQYQWA